MLAYSWTALIDGSGTVTETIEDSLATASLRAPERFRSLLYAKAGDEGVGVVRTKVISSTGLHDSYHHSDRTITAELVLMGLSIRSRIVYIWAVIIPT